MKKYIYKRNLQKKVVKNGHIRKFLIHKILVLIKSHMNYLKDNIFERFFKSKTDFYFFQKKFFSQHIIIENPRPEAGKMIKDIRNRFKLKKPKLQCNYMTKILTKVTRIKPFINKYKLGGINFSSEKDD